MISNFSDGYKFRAQQGFSLVELLIASVLGLLLTAGMLATFAGNKRSADLNAEMAAMQESTRYALNVLTEEVRMAGYQGCMDVSGGMVDTIANNPPSDNLQATIISGAVVQTDGSWLPAPGLGTGTAVFSPPTTVTPRPGTHTLAIQFSKTPGSGIVGPQVISSVPNAAAPLVLSREINIRAGDLGLVSTCDGGEIFRVSSTSVANDGTMTLGHAASHNSRGAFQRIYGVPGNLLQTRVMAFATHVYFVGDSGSEYPDGAPIYALYQQTMPFDESNNPPVMLVEGVENMRISFGIGAINGQLRYTTATDTEYDPEQIRSVRIGLLVSSRDDLLSQNDSNNYMLAGETISKAKEDDTDVAAGSTYADDRRLRLSFNTAAAVRNRRAQQ